MHLTSLPGQTGANPASGTAPKDTALRADRDTFTRLVAVPGTNEEHDESVNMPVIAIVDSDPRENGSAVLMPNEAALPGQLKSNSYEPVTAQVSTQHNQVGGKDKSGLPHHRDQPASTKQDGAGSIHQAQNHAETDSQILAFRGTITSNAFPVSEHNLRSLTQDANNRVPKLQVLQRPNYVNKTDILAVPPHAEPAQKETSVTVASNMPNPTVKPTPLITPNMASPVNDTQILSMKTTSTRLPSDSGLNLVADYQARNPSATTQRSTMSALDRHLTRQTATLLAHPEMVSPRGIDGTLILSRTAIGQTHFTIHSGPQSTYTASAKTFHFPSDPVTNNRASIAGPAFTQTEQPILATAMAGTNTTSMQIPIATSMSFGDLSDSNKSAEPDMIAWDVRTSAPNQTGTMVHGPNRPDLPPHLTQQIAQALHSNADSPIEIALNPAELGRLRMVLNATDAGIIVTITADRPETLDLMRRNIEDLGQSLSEMGYDDVSFSFGAEAQTEQRDEASDHSVPLDTDGVTDNADTSSLPISALPRPFGGSHGIDIRF